MININDIIKFSDYKDIYLESKDCFVYKTERKKYNIKGSNVEKYVYPIFYEMFQPNFVFDLLQNINDKSKDKETDNEICEDDFLKIVFKLYNLGIIEVVKEDSLLGEKESMTNNFKMFNINDEEMNNIVKSKDITIINFLNPKDVVPLLNELIKIAFNEINLIDFHSDILDITEKSLFRLDSEKLKVTCKKYANILKIKDELPQSDFLITLHSAQNTKINSFINELIL